jgi:hypothetical protein
LQVVTATPYLPGLARLSDILRTAHLDPTGFQVPIPTRTPEAVLAECLAYGIPVAGSRIVYRAPASRRPVALDRVPPAVGPQRLAGLRTQPSSAGRPTPREAADGQ